MNPERFPALAVLLRRTQVSYQTPPTSYEVLQDAALLAKDYWPGCISILCLVANWLEKICVFGMHSGTDWLNSRPVALIQAQQAWDLLTKPVEQADGFL